MNVSTTLTSMADARPRSSSTSGGSEARSSSCSVDDPRTAEQAFAALAEGGSIKMPLQKTFWAPLYGFVVDRFAIPWGRAGCSRSSPRSGSRSNIVAVRARR